MVLSNNKYPHAGSAHYCTCFNSLMSFSLCCIQNQLLVNTVRELVPGVYSDLDTLLRV